MPRGWARLLAVAIDGYLRYNDQFIGDGISSIERNLRPLAKIYYALQAAPKSVKEVYPHATRRRRPRAQRLRSR